MKVSRTTATLVAVMTLVVVVGSLLLFRHNLARVWASAQPKNQDFAQLAFENPLKVPTYLKAGEPYSFDFWVGSHFDEATQQKYVVYLEGEAGREELASGTVALAPWQRTQVGLTVLMPQVQSRQKIVVELPELRQSIHFWATGVTK